jgi:hypothetical protein
MVKWAVNLDRDSPPAALSTPIFTKGHRSGKFTALTSKSQKFLGCPRLTISLQVAFGSLGGWVLSLYERMNTGR